MQKPLAITVAMLIIIGTGTGTARTADKLGKIFVKAATADVNGQQFPDAQVEDSVKDIRKRPGKFELVDKESDADFLLIVVERKATAISGQPASKTITATLSVKDGSAWKPAAKFQSGVRNTIWAVAAENIISQAEKWVKAHGK